MKKKSFGSDHYQNSEKKSSVNFDSDDGNENVKKKYTNNVVKEKSKIIFTSDQLKSFCSLAESFLLLKPKTVQLTILTDLLKKRELNIEDAGFSIKMNESGNALLNKSSFFVSYC